MLQRYLDVRRSVTNRRPMVVVCVELEGPPGRESFLRTLNRYSGGWVPLVFDESCQIPLTSQMDSTVEMLRITEVQSGGSEQHRLVAERYIGGRPANREWRERFLSNPDGSVSLVIEHVRLYPVE